MDLSLVESSLLTLCDYLHTPWKQHALYMIDCLCSLFPAFFPIVSTILLFLRSVFHLVLSMMPFILSLNGLFTPRSARTTVLHV